MKMAMLLLAYEQYSNKGICLIYPIIKVCIHEGNPGVHSRKVEALRNEGSTNHIRFRNIIEFELLRLNVSMS